MNLPDNERERLEALFRYKILDTEKEEFYNSITDLAASIMGVPFASIAFVDDSRLWMKACYGFDGTEVPREHTFCSQAIMSNGPLVVMDATQDIRFCNNPYVVGQPNVRFYFGEPLVTHDKKVIGVLCGVDVCTRLEVTPTQVKGMQTLSKMVMDQLEMREFLVSVHEGFQKLNKLSIGEAPRPPSIVEAYQELNLRCDNIIDRIKDRRAKK